MTPFVDRPLSPTEMTSPCRVITEISQLGFSFQRYFPRWGKNASRTQSNFTIETAIQFVPKPSAMVFIAGADVFGHPIAPSVAALISVTDQRRSTKDARWLFS
jgi:hypothetical protein